MIRAIRIRLYPTPDQKKYLAGLFGAVRFCFNKALYLKTHFYRERQKFCVHGIIGARQSGASNEHEYQTQFS